MDLRYSESDEAFRKELREWLADVLPTLPPEPAVDDWPGRREYDTDWQRRLFEAGYAGISWPTEYGGRGATLVEQLIYLEETTRAGAPYVGVNFVGHAARRADDHDRGHATSRRPSTCPASSAATRSGARASASPTPGSDLGSLSCRGVRDGDEYVITGQKTGRASPRSPTGARCCIRTDPDAPKHKGITWVMFPMDTPGIEIRPIHTIAGTDRVQRGLLRRGPGAGRQPGRPRERRLARRHGDVRLRAGHRLRLRPGRDRPDDLRARAPGPHRHPSRRPPRGTTSRCGARSATCRPRWTRCGP